MWSLKFIFYGRFGNDFLLKLTTLHLVHEPWWLNWLFRRYLMNTWTIRHSLLLTHAECWENMGEVDRLLHQQAAAEETYISNWNDLESWKCPKRQLCRRPCLVLLDLGQMFLRFFYIAPLNSQLFIYNRPVGARTLSTRCYASFWPKRR